MRNTTTTLLAFIPLALFSFLGCGGDSAQSHDNGEAHSQDDGHNHGDEAQGHGEDSGADEHQHSGETHELSSVTAAGTTLDVTFTGNVEPGSEVHVELELSGGPVPGSVRLWIGLESGVGSLKAKADDHGGHYDAHVEVPIELAANAKLWIQVESSSGQAEARGVELP